MKDFLVLICMKSMVYLMRFFVLALFFCHVSKGEVRTVWQTLHDYNTVVDADGDARQDRQRVNPFLSYTHIGTDFGFVGPGEKNIGWRVGEIGMNLENIPDGWAGMWHSMSRLASMRHDVMNFNSCYPSSILPFFQPKINGLRFILKGKGTLKIELLNPENDVLWHISKTIDTPDFQELMIDVSGNNLSRVKLLNWIGEPGSVIDIQRLDLRVFTPDISYEQWIFLASYAKSLTCWSANTGLVRDRAHINDGDFDSISSTGLFCLSTAAAADLGIVSREFANEVLRKSIEATQKLIGPNHLLPHFAITEINGVTKIHPNTEYSTIDTSLFYFSAMLSAKMLNDEAVLASLLATAKKIDFTSLRTPEGYISHGVKSDGKTMIPFYWRDWGGETAIVLLMEKMIDPEVTSKMEQTRWPHQGTGFIGEIQSLFFPDFDSEKEDAVSNANWLSVRINLLKLQKEYFSKTSFANSPNGFHYGLSAGENRRGAGYTVGGVDLLDQTLVHPHYVLMSACTDENPQAVLQVMRKLEEYLIFTPWGMVENVEVKYNDVLPMIGSLNATFEAISAYHFASKISKKKDAIYDASMNIPEVRAAMKAFYP
jgi:hypothetical protein